MKRIILYIFLLLFSTILYSQTTLENFIGYDTNNILELKQDSMGVNQNDQSNIRVSSSQYYSENLYPHIPTSFDINKNKNIGSISISSSMTQSGAMTLNVPIETFINPAGSTPQISIAYNSQYSNSSVGAGWSIAGISEISVSNKNFYYNNETKPISKYDNLNFEDGAFSLDGNRLIYIKKEVLKSYPPNSKMPNYAANFMGGNQFFYETESGNIKVIATCFKFKYIYASMGGIGEIFYIEAFYPDGKIITYGRKGLEYYLSPTLPATQIIDNMGNIVNIEYEEYGYTYPDRIKEEYATPRLKRIRYGDGLKASIEFNYVACHNPTIYFMMGRKYTQGYSLSSIKTILDNTELRSYSFSYIEKNNTTLLDKIECSVDNKPINPLIFYYGENNTLNDINVDQTQLTSFYEFTENNAIRALRGKFDYGTDNDGIITLPNKISYLEVYKPAAILSHSKHYIENQYTGDESIYVNIGLSETFSESIPIKTGTGFLDIFCMDIDDFPGEEIVKVNNFKSGSQDILEFHVYTASLYSGISKLYTRRFVINTPLLNHRSDYSLIPKYFHVGDFDGDGRQEVFMTTLYHPWDISYLTSRNYIFDLAENKTKFESSALSAGVIDYWAPILGSYNPDGTDVFNRSDKLYVIDYDGDGKSDICKINTSGTYIYSFQGAGFKEIAFDANLNNNLIANRKLMIGHFNSDGKTDFILSPAFKGGSTWIIFYSKGIDGFNQANIDLREYNSTYQYLLHDINNDAQSDLIVQIGGRPSYNGNIGFVANPPTKIYTNVISNGHLIEASSYTPEKNSVSTPILIPIDINKNDIYSQLIGIQKNKGEIQKISFNQNTKRSNILTGFINSSGTVLKVGYRAINEENSTFYQGSDAKFPYQNFKGDFMVVSRMETYNNGVNIESKSYEYHNAVIHKQGLGFRGFQKITTHDHINGYMTSKTFDPYNFGILKSIDSPTQATSYNYSVDVASNKIAKVLLTSQTETDKLKNISTKTSYVHDNYGNPTTITVDYGSNLKSITTNKYNNLTGTIYKLGELAEQTVTNIKNTESSLSKKTIEYNEVRLPISKKNYYNNNQISEEVYLYNSDNRLISLKTKAYSSPNWFETQYTYAPLGQVLRTTDPMGFYTENTYTSKGLLESVKNHKGQVTSYIYDNWGRLTQTSHPDGTTTSTSMSWVTTPLSVDALYMVSSSATGQPTNNIYYDALGREVRTSQVRFDGTELKTDKQYNTKGLLSQVSLPYKNNSPIWNTYTYDTYNRITEVNYTSGKKDVISYNGAKVTSIQDGISSTKEYNVLGQLSSVTDEAGSIAYNYRADGQTSSIVAPGGCSTVSEIPLYDRLIFVIADKFGVPESIITRSTHFRNELGADELDLPELIMQVEREFDIEIDINGMDILNGTLDIPTVNDLNMLVAKALGDAPTPQPITITTSFTYDNYGRQTSIIDPSAGTKSFVYDEAGNISTETDAEGRVTRMSYDNFNRITEKDVVGEKKSTYTYDTESQLISVASNDGTSTAYSYDQLGRVISEKETVLDNKWLQRDFVYNNGILSSLSYKSQSEDIATEHYTYTNGHLSEIKLNGTKSIFKLGSENDMGAVTGVTTGNLTRSYSFDQNGLPTERITKNGATVIQNFGYSIDPLTGNLAWRKDNIRNIQEDFGYDNLNRLISFGGNTIIYDPKGNITENSSVGRFEYNHPDKPYALTDVTIYGEVIPMRNQQITYNGMMRPSSISENDYTATLAYGHSNNRIKMSLMLNNTDILTRYYIGGQYEIDETLAGTKERLYLGGDAYSAAAVLVKENGVWNVNYICRDYLGSITHVTDEAGIVRQELSYDPWGRLRNPETQELYAVDNQPELLLGRGYTGHEHLPWFGLINMNARLYDPILGRFLSPDPYVQAPDFSQNYNRYSYCLNNPLRYTDPSGEYALIDDLIAACLGGIINVVSQAISGNIDSVGEGFSYFGVGFIGGWASLYATPVVGGAIVSAGNDAINQGFENGFNNINWESVGINATVGAITGYASSAVSSTVTPYVSTLTSNISSPILREGANQTLIGFSNGFAVGTGFSLANGDGWDVALTNGLKNGGSGATIGAATGIASGFRIAHKEGVSPWTGKNKGQNIVGTSHQDVRPTQDWLDKQQVEAYKNQIKNGEPVKPITAYEVNGKTYIEDGHHRYVAYKELGKTPVVNIHGRGGPIGYPDWTKTSFQNIKW